MNFDISVSPAYVAPADRGSSAGCHALVKSYPGPCYGAQIQLLDMQAAAPQGDRVAGGCAGVVSEVHSKGIAGRVPAW